MYLADEHKIWVCKGEDKICMLPKMANRHGLIAGATGTGKTVTLKVLAESFSEMGVPVFLADIKGDVSGMCKAGESSEGFQKRLHKLGIENFEFKGFPDRNRLLENQPPAESLPRPSAPSNTSRRASGPPACRALLLYNRIKA